MLPTLLHPLHLWATIAHALKLHSSFIFLAILLADTTMDPLNAKVEAEALIPAFELDRVLNQGPSTPRRLRAATDSQ